MSCAACQTGASAPRRDAHLCYAWTCAACGDEVWDFPGDRGPDQQVRAAQADIEAARAGNVGALLPAALDAIGYGGQAGERAVGRFLAEYQPDLALWEHAVEARPVPADTWTHDLVRRGLAVLATERATAQPDVGPWRATTALDDAAGTGSGAPVAASARAVQGVLFVHAAGPLYSWQRGGVPVLLRAEGRACQPLVGPLWAEIARSRTTVLRARGDGTVRQWDAFDAEDVQLAADMLGEVLVALRWSFEPWLAVAKRTWQQERGRTDVWRMDGTRVARIEGWGGRLVPGAPNDGYWSLDEADEAGLRVPVSLRDGRFQLVARCEGRTEDPRETVQSADVVGAALEVGWLWSGLRRDRWEWDGARIVRTDLAVDDTASGAHDKILQKGWLYRSDSGTAYRPPSGTGWQEAGAWVFADPPTGLALLRHGDRFIAVDAWTGARSPHLDLADAPQSVAARAVGRTVWFAAGASLCSLDVEAPPDSALAASVALPWPLRALVGPWDGRLVGAAADVWQRHVVVNVTGLQPHVEGVVEAMLCAGGGDAWGPLFVGERTWRMGRWPGA
ncbi:MAG: hypothetical protein EXR79_12395 [Myxococcales bacterium]|nr:hypothetical protein [Myxococcales bacterium]